jgi:hypothetical protein
MGLIHVGIAALPVEQGGSIDSMIECKAELSLDELGLLLGSHTPFQQRLAQSEFQQTHDLTTQGRQRFPLICVELSGDPVNHAERTEGIPVWSHQRSSGVKTDERVSGNQWIRGKARVRERIGYLEDRALQDGMGAECDVARRFARGYPCFRLEPLPKGVDEAHQRDWRLADLGCQLDKVVKGLFGFGVEDLIPMQRVETS